MIEREHRTEEFKEQHVSAECMSGTHHSTSLWVFLSFLFKIPHFLLVVIFGLPLLLLNQAPWCSLYSRTVSKCCFYVYPSHGEVLVFLWSTFFLRDAALPCIPLLSPSRPANSEHLPLLCSFSHFCWSGRFIPEGTSRQMFEKGGAGMEQFVEDINGFCRCWCELCRWTGSPCPCLTFKCLLLRREALTSFMLQRVRC